MFTAEAYSLLRTEPPRDAPTANCATGGLTDWQLRRVKTFVENNLHNPVRVEGLSSIVGLSVSQFARAFKLRTGQTPHQYITLARLERGGHLIGTTDDELSDIALACRFADQAPSSRLFRKHLGLTPATWRRQQRALQHDTREKNADP